MDVLRYSAFTDDPAGGNPAGVVLDAQGASDEEMQALAAAVGYSETAFVTASNGGGEYDLRYFSPVAEVAFCGHATIAAAVAMERTGDLVFHTRNGPVPVIANGRTATLTSVEPRVAELSEDDLDRILTMLRWSRDDLDEALPARIGYAGVYHPILAVATRERLAALDYDFEALGDLMRERDWTTIQIVWREHESLFHARDPFAVAGIVEDPATGAAAAAFGAYLRELGVVTPPASVTILQGEDMGRRSLLEVRIPATGGVAVTGEAVPI
jgi:PhzF family phenazine biosynthesis protein